MAKTLASQAKDGGSIPLARSSRANFGGRRKRAGESLLRACRERWSLRCRGGVAEQPGVVRGQRGPEILDLAVGEHEAEHGDDDRAVMGGGLRVDPSAVAHAGDEFVARKPLVVLDSGDGLGELAGKLVGELEGLATREPLGQCGER